MNYEIELSDNINYVLVINKSLYTKDFSVFTISEFNEINKMSKSICDYKYHHLLQAENIFENSEFENKYIEFMDTRELNNSEIYKCFYDEHCDYLRTTKNEFRNFIVFHFEDIQEYYNFIEKIK
jgi:hypothetical protein